MKNPRKSRKPTLSRTSVAREGRRTAMDELHDAVKGTAGKPASTASHVDKLLRVEGPQNLLGSPGVSFLGTIDEVQRLRVAAALRAKLREQRDGHWISATEYGRAMSKLERFEEDGNGLPLGVLLAARPFNLRIENFLPRPTIDPLRGLRS